MPRYSIETFSQCEQEPGFWLISMTLSAPRPTKGQKKGEEKFPPPSSCCFDIGSHFHIENNIPLYLFQQTVVNNQLQLQFLAEQAVESDLSLQQLQVTPSTRSSHSLITQCQNVPNLLLLGSGIQMATLFYTAKQRSQTLQNATQTPNVQTLALLHSTENFPFKVKPALLMAPNLPPEAIGTSTLLEDWQIPNRLASNQDLPGCFEGSLDELFFYWLTQQNHSLHASNKPWTVLIFAPENVQKKCLKVSRSYDWIHCLDIHRD